MGIFGFFKKNKQEMLSLQDKYSANFIQSLTLGMSTIKIGDKIKVPDGWWAVFVVKDKPRDVLESGEWIISLDKIPAVTKVLKLDKPYIEIKKGKGQKVYKQEFKCDLYFVNKAIFGNQAWQTDTITMRTKDKTKYTVALSGVCDYKCVSPANAIKLFLYDWAKIESPKAQKRLCEFIGESAGDALKWENDLTPQQIDDKAYCAEMLLPKINKSLSKYGIVIENFVVSKADFSIEMAAILTQEKLEHNIASDAINELGAEISVVDEKAIKPNKRAIKTEDDTPAEEGKVAGVLDMTEGTESAEPADISGEKPSADEEIVETNGEASLEDLPKISLKSKKNKQ